MAGTDLQTGTLTPVATAPVDEDGTYRLTAEAPASVLAQLTANRAANLLILIKGPKAVIPRFTTWKPGNVLDLGPNRGALAAAAAASSRATLDVRLSPTESGALVPGTTKARQAAGTPQPTEANKPCAAKKAGTVRGRFTPVAEMFMYDDLNASFVYRRGAEVDVEASATGGAGRLDAGFTRVDSTRTGSGTEKLFRPNEARVVVAAMDYTLAKLNCNNGRSRTFVTGAAWTGALEKRGRLPRLSYCAFRPSSQRVSLTPGEKHYRDKSSATTFSRGVSVAGVGIDVRSRYSTEMNATWVAGTLKRRHLLCAEKSGVNPTDAARLVAGPNLKLQ